eukprot:jgi/Ulvmu1/7385/UM036_0045.1
MLVWTTTAEHASIPMKMPTGSRCLNNSMLTRLPIWSALRSMNSGSLHVVWMIFRFCESWGLEARLECVRSTIMQQYRPRASVPGRNSSVQVELVQYNGDMFAFKRFHMDKCPHKTADSARQCAEEFDAMKAAFEACIALPGSDDQMKNVVAVYNLVQDANARPERTPQIRGFLMEYLRGGAS